MKKLILILAVTLIGLTSNAQEPKSKNKKVEIEVSGVCNMCKKRIEKAAYSVKGVKSADWHSDHQDIHLIIDETKCTVEDVRKAIAKAGHDTDLVKATDEAYEKVHDCCKYRTAEKH